MNLAKKLSILEYLIRVWYEINILGGITNEIKKDMMWNNNFGWKILEKSVYFQNFVVKTVLGMIFNGDELNSKD